MSFWVRSSGVPLSAFFLAASLALSAAILISASAAASGDNSSSGFVAFAAAESNIKAWAFGLLKTYQSMSFSVITTIESLIGCCLFRAAALAAVPAGEESITSIADFDAKR